MKYLLALSILSASLVGTITLSAQTKTTQVASSTIDLFSETRKFSNDVNQLAENNFNAEMYKKFLSRIMADIDRSVALKESASAADAAIYAEKIKKMTTYKALVEKEISSNSKKTKASLINSINNYLSL